jgi:hypothetical protein
VDIQLKIISTRHGSVGISIKIMNKKKLLGITLLGIPIVIYFSVLITAFGWQIVAQTLGYVICGLTLMLSIMLGIVLLNEDSKKDLNDKL